MRLEQIKLSGFKSFVDPTVVRFPGNLMGIVGPNGCGKSNIIDAVRWVMGESSAKQLRGESLSDVIFNGSVERKPVGQAAIELIFDNSAGKLVGQYAEYSQIAIRREVSRDGQSIYYLNGTRCRRRDITDIFLGTGLGPRSYAIIEQGTISRVIEAKPEELRAYLEEVAGISKYKERRRETENRIKHTQENLDRVRDIREELATQLRRLKRQASAAERYKVLKAEQRLLKAQLLTLRWQALQHTAQNYSTDVSEQETKLESHRSTMAAANTRLEKQREEQAAFNETLHEIQGRYYSLGEEIARYEQTIQHQEERKRQMEKDFTETDVAFRTAQQGLDSDQQAAHALSKEAHALEPTQLSTQQRAETSQKQLAQAEEEMQQWQEEWDAFNEQASHAAQTAELEQARIRHLEERQIQANQQLRKIDDEQKQLPLQSVQFERDALEKAVQQEGVQLRERQQALQEGVARITSQRDENQQLMQAVETARGMLQKIEREKLSLEALQEAAMGANNAQVMEWLDQHALRENPRLLQSVAVEHGWEAAVETVLGGHLQAVCVQDIAAVASWLPTLKKGRVTLLDAAKGVRAGDVAKDRVPLAQKVTSKMSLGGLLDGIYVVDSLSDALAKRDTLRAHESFITQDAIWLGANWICMAKTEDAQSGMLAREHALRAAQKSLDSIAKQFQEAERRLSDGQKALEQAEQRRETLQEAVSEAQKAYAEVHARFQVVSSQCDHLQGQLERLTQARADQESILAKAQAELQQTREKWQVAMERIERNADRRDALLVLRDTRQKALEEVRAIAREDQQRMHDVALRWQSVQTQLAAYQQAIARAQSHITHLTERRKTLQQNLSTEDQPTDQLQDALKLALEQRAVVDKELIVARQRSTSLEHDIHQSMKQYREAEAQAEKTREALGSMRLQHQEIHVRQATLQEQIVESGFSVEDLQRDMPEGAEADGWQENIENVATRIARLGPINLAAIEEYEQLSERKNYLDAQNADLEEALETLQNAIRKIDAETRSRFRATFEHVNTTFKSLFPKVFGGGTAYLEMTDSDLLHTGVQVMARPPGKHITSIHLLSGGEKALTAIALVFSLFQLNPAPFCMLDEVDAPLDDSNVGRFCDLVKEMAQNVQFIFISHNKIAIEMAQQLTGVTMHEPGVSRIVAVDVDAAVAMVE